MKHLFIVVVIAVCCALPARGATTPLQTFTVKDYLNHGWTNELIHFPIAYRAWRMPRALELTDAAGRPVPSQVSGLGRRGLTITGAVWTVVNVPPKGEVVLQLRKAATPSVSHSSPPSHLSLAAQGQDYVLRNEFMALRLPKLPGALAQPVEVSELPAPLMTLAGADGARWLGQGVWTNKGESLRVTNATTTVVEQGPVRVTVRYRLAFADGRFYQAEIMLGDRQECALFTDDTDVEATNAVFRFSFQPGLGADRLFWRNNYYADSYKGLTGEPLAFDQERIVCSICPWSFWWLQDRTTWAGFYRDAGDAFVGILALRPSRWRPIGWSGFDRTVIPITTRQGGGLDVTLGLCAWTEQKADGSAALSPAHRELAITVGPASGFLDKRKMAILKEAEAARQRQDMGAWNRLLGEGMWLFKLRRQLLQYSEFPLDEVKDFGFDIRLKTAGRPHPFLLFSQADIERARRQAQVVPSAQAALEKDTRYMARLGCDPVKKIQDGPDGWLRFYRENYVGNGLGDCAPRTYADSADPQYGLILSSGVRGLADTVMDQFLRDPGRSSIGANAHLGTTSILQLLLTFDALADTQYLTAEDRAHIQAVLIFGAHVTDHPDYWNTDVGLCSANPNMTSLMKLPLGLLALYLDGHPKSDAWLKYAEDELKREIRGEWIAPGGAWLECPMYQAVSLDGMFMLSQAMKNVRGADYFAEPQFKATMDYYGFILTPPDRRFPPSATNAPQGYMTVPSIGDAFPGFATPFNGWMARETAKTDPAFSARQQFYWQGQAYSIINGGRAGSFAMALCDADLPAAPPSELSRAFPGFGNILRTSWTDPKASYVSHRCGTFLHHFDPGDYNSIQYFAKGAPLCVDFGHRGATAKEVETMWRADYHTTVSYDLVSSAKYWGKSGGPLERNRQAQEVRSLPQTIDYSTGMAFGSGNQADYRHLLLVKSADPLGANYLVIRDVTQDGQPNQEFFWNLWCMAREPEIAGNVAHFPGIYGVDLDAHILAPAEPQFAKDSYSYEQWVHPWGKFSEAQTAVHVRKQGSIQDFFTVLYPRSAGQGPAQVTALASNAAARIAHLEGTDVVLLSPGKPAAAAAGDARVAGEIAFARRYAAGAIRLAVLTGTDALAALGPWELRSSGPTAVAIEGAAVTGESSGEAHEAILVLPAECPARDVILDGRPVSARKSGNRIQFRLPAGPHSFIIR